MKLWRFSYGGNQGARNNAESAINREHNKNNAENAIKSQRMIVHPWRRAPASVMEELNGFLNAEDYYSWIWIGAICSNCGTHIQGLVDMETA